jgi:hypothetical protein
MKAPDDLEALLDAERDIDAPAPAQRERMRTRLQPLLLVSAGIGAGAAAASATATSAASATAEAGASAVVAGALRAKLVAAVMSAAIVGGAVGAAGHAWVSSKSAPVAPPAPAPAAPKVVPVASTEPLPTVAPEPPASAAPSATPPSSAPRTEERARGARSLRAERLLIETASAALVRGDNASAIAALRRHARTFPNGDLAEEREVLLVKALSASGDDAAAKRRAKDFKHKFPGSLQQDSVDKAAPLK